MRLLCLQENLNKGLSIVSRAVPSRTTLPITQNVLITTDNGKIKLVTTNPVSYTHLTLPTTPYV